MTRAYTLYAPRDPLVKHGEPTTLTLLLTICHPLERFSKPWRSKGGEQVERPSQDLPWSARSSNTRRKYGADRYLPAYLADEAGAMQLKFLKGTLGLHFMGIQLETEDVRRCG
jgi:hypothetical protein